MATGFGNLSDLFMARYGAYMQPAIEEARLTDPFLYMLLPDGMYRNGKDGVEKVQPEGWTIADLAQELIRE
jgi:hypothetical protein